MKINCDYFRDRERRRIERNTVEHDWFAWYPVRIKYGDCRWLETVRRVRKFGFHQDYWSYSLK